MKENEICVKARDEIKKVLEKYEVDFLFDQNIAGDAFLYLKDKNNNCCEVFYSDNGIQVPEVVEIEEDDYLLKYNSEKESVISV